MADQLQLRGGTEAENDAFTGAQREVTVDTENSTLRVHDGSTPGGKALLKKEEVGTAAAADVGTSEGEVPENDSTSRLRKDVPVVVVRDTYRAAVEAAGGGKQTVLYDDLGNPSIMVVIPAFNLQDIHGDFGSGVHPAFLVDGVYKSEIFIGAFQATDYSDRAYSLPGQAPRHSINWDQSRGLCTAKGSGWHMMTNWEWAAVALWVLKQVADGNLAHQPRGNTNYGSAHDALIETGTRNDDGVPGDSSGTGNILTGTGPATWRHDLTPFGISDLVGNVWEWVDGLKIIDGAIYMPQDNDYSMVDSDFPAQDATIVDANPWSSGGVTIGAGGDAQLLRAALLEPANVSDAAQGRLTVNTDGEQMPGRGGSRARGSNAGLAELSLSSARSHSATGIGFRPCYIAP